MTVHTITIPSWHPTAVNQLLKVHHMQAYRLKKADKQMVGVYCKVAGVTRATGKRRVDLHITLGSGERGVDVDGYWKVTLDCLVACGAIRDDNRQWCEITPVTFDRGPVKATRITLTDLESDNG